MRYHVDWAPEAESDLARLWNESTDRASLRRAVDQLDEQLARDPIGTGESRRGVTRIGFFGEIVALFDLDVANSRVEVWRLWRSSGSRH